MWKEADCYIDDRLLSRFMIDMGHSDKYDLNNQKSILEVMTMSETAKPEIKVFPIHQD